MFILADLNGGAIAGIVIGCVVAGFLLGFFLARFLIKRELKNNPPINEKQIRAMYLSMGRKPSEAQIKATMRAIQDAGNDKQKKN